MQSEENDLRQRTKEFGLQIVRMFSGLPKTTEAQVLGKQVLRSGTSIGANYREAYRAPAVERNGASGASDMHGNAARVAESEPGGERMNLSRNAVIRYVSSRRQLTGSNCSSMERSFRQIRSQLSGKNAMNSSPFLLRF
jgi:hypothetical protein